MPAHPRSPAGAVGFRTLLLLALASAPTAASAAAQGWIEPTRPGDGGVERVESRIRVIVEGPVARVEVDEWFVNHGGDLAEGHYLYPLPTDVALSGVSLYQGEEELRGEVMDAAEARRIYEEIVRRRRDPALVEYLGAGLFRARVFPIAPGETRRVTLRYVQVLEASGNSLQYRFVGAERAEPLPVWERAMRSSASRAAPLDFELRAAPARDWATPFSPTHALETDRWGDTLVVRASDVPSGRMSIFLPRAGEVAALTVLTHRAPGEDGFALLSVTPPEAPAHRVPRDIVVVLDVSGSMAGEKIDQARGAVRGLLDGLGPDDRFRLISFSNGVAARDAGWSRVTPGQIDAARRWVEGLRADGGTNIGGALAEALRVAPGAERLPIVLFLTDGLPTVGERDPIRIAAETEGSRGRFRVFAFGVGHDVNTALLDRLSVATRGTTQYVEPGEDVERAVSLLALRIRHPVLTDLRIDASPVELMDIHPVNIPDVFAGENLVLLARYRGTGTGDLVIEGRQAGQTRTLSQRVSFPRSAVGHAELPRLWAARKIGHLTRQLWLEGDDPGLVEEITATALRYGLPSPFTSILVEEPMDVVAALPATFDHATPQSAPMPAAAAPRLSGVTGESAVRAAEEARRFRSLDRLEQLDDLMAEADDGDQAIRRVGGRVFEDRNGVWTERGLDERLRRVEVERFSEAWFALIAALPEIADVTRTLERVELAGRTLRIAIGPAGSRAWSAGELDRVVRGFRPER